jgi:hypothetical protein
MQLQMGHFFLLATLNKLASALLPGFRLMTRTLRHDFSWCLKTLLADVNSKPHRSHVYILRLLMLWTLTKL